MTTICRIAIQDSVVPEINYEVEDGFLVIKGPANLTISDSSDLCQYLRCRKHVTIGRKGCPLKFCHEHNEYLKQKQRENYNRHKRKNESGLCMHHGCSERRAPTKSNPNRLGQCCAIHAREKNERVQAANKKQKLNKE
jgi:hypothetical protein